MLAVFAACIIMPALTKGRMRVSDPPTQRIPSPRLEPPPSIIGP